LKGNGSRAEMRKPRERKCKSKQAAAGNGELKRTTGRSLARAAA